MRSSARRRPAIGLTSRILVRSAVIALVVGSLGTTEMRAASSGPSARLGLTPVGQTGLYFDLTMAPGEKRSLRVEVANFGADVVKTRTYVADAYSMVNGGFAAALFGAPRSGSAGWLDYPDRELTLRPGDVIPVDFPVAVPVATPPGQYVTSVVAESADLFHSGAGSIAFDQVNRVAIAVAIEVPGASRPAIRIGAVSHKTAGGLSFVSFGVANPGNVHLKPIGRFVLRDADRAELVAMDVAMDSVYAGMKTRLEVPLPSALRPADYCAELRLTDPTTKVSDSTECLPFAVAALTDGDAGPAGTDGSDRQTVPLVDGVIESARTQPTLAVVLVALLFGLVAIVIAIVRRRRRASEPPSGR
jgi:hypothetical protein